MKKALKKLLIIALACSAALSCLILPASAVEANPTIRVGLAYGTGTLSAAHLQNANGYGRGFRLGYFDGSYQFVQLATVSTDNIAILKDKNIYYDASQAEKRFSSTLVAGQTGVVGAYHLELAGVYYSYEEAASNCIYDGCFPAYVNGAYRVRVGQYSSVDEANTAGVSRQFMNYTVVGDSSTCYTVVDRYTAAVLFEFDNGGAGLGVMPDVTNAYDVQTWFAGFKYRGGFEYRRLSGGDITVINYVTIDDYAKGILPYEMSADWPIEALKAQCLAAKSYTLCSIGKHRSSGFDLCNTTDCQVYRGCNSANSNSDLAVNQTSGEYVLYNGQPAQCFYYSSNGGASEDAGNVWNEDIPYLKGVVDNYETIDSSYSHTFTPTELGWLFNASGYSNSGTIVQCYVSQKTAMGNVYAVTFVDSNGKTMTITKEAARNLFYSNTLGNKKTSQRFDVITNYADGSSSGGSDGGAIYVNGSASDITEFTGVYAIGSSGTAAIGSKTAYAISGSGTADAVSPSGGSAPSGGGTAVSFTVSGSGLGHNVGMSQWGAHAMATAGYTYRDILAFYYTGVTIGR